MGVGGDDALPEESKKEWQIFRKSLLVLNNLNMPRCIIIPEEIIDIQIHEFPGASIKVYGACL